MGNGFQSLRGIRCFLPQGKGFLLPEQGLPVRLGPAGGSGPEPVLLPFQVLRFLGPGGQQLQNHGAFVAQKHFSEHLFKERPGKLCPEGIEYLPGVHVQRRISAVEPGAGGVQSQIQAKRLSAFPALELQAVEGGGQLLPVQALFQDGRQDRPEG